MKKSVCEECGHTWDLHTIVKNPVSKFSSAAPKLEWACPDEGSFTQSGSFTV